MARYVEVGTPIPTPITDEKKDKLGVYEGRLLC